MHLLRRKKKWQRVVGKMTSSAAKSPVAKTGAAAVTGIVAAVAASAVASAVRRKTDS